MFSHLTPSYHSLEHDVISLIIVLPSRERVKWGHRIDAGLDHHLCGAYAHSFTSRRREVVPKFPAPLLLRVFRLVQTHNRMQVLCRLDTHGNSFRTNAIGLRQHLCETKWCGRDLQKKNAFSVFHFARNSGTARITAPVGKSSDKYANAHRCRS